MKLPVPRVFFRLQAVMLAATMCAACAGSRNDANTSATASPTSAATAAVATAASTGEAAGTNAMTAAPADVFSAAPAPQPSFGAATDALLAPQPGLSYQLLLGPATIDDGGSGGTAAVGKAIATVGTTVAGLLSSGTPPPEAGATPATVLAALDLAGKIPASEYDLGELTKSLPDDPVAIYRVVTDQIALDGYDGVLRGPLVTWMSRAGGPTDKAALLAYCFLSKGIAYQFVRGTLADDERTRLAAAAANAPVTTSTNPAVTAYVQKQLKAGVAFAGWARGLLSGRQIDLGDATPPSALYAPRHYWLQIDRGGKLLDLDPTLPGTAEGTHLGTIDTAFKPWAALPAQEWHQMQIRVVATNADGTRKTLLEHIDTVPNIAYTPIRIAFAPAASGSDPTQIAGVTDFAGGLKVGSEAAIATHVDIGPQSTLRSLALEIRRTIPGSSAILVARRMLLDPALPAARRAEHLAGMTTIVVAPGRGANAFTLHEQALALAALAHDVAEAKAGQTPAAHAWYPIRIADFFGRDDAVADALASSAGGRLYRDRPDVAMQRTWFDPDASGTSHAVNVFDIGDNGMASTAGAASAAVDANLTRGYADTAMERDVQEDGGPANTIAVFAAAGGQSAQSVVSTQSAPTDASDPLRAGLDQTFTGGNVAIVPGRSVSIDGTPSFGWWSIDPVTGNAVGRMTGGFGQDLAEESVTINTISRAYTLYGQLQAGATCLHDGFASIGCTVAVCGSIASYVFGGGTALKLASNYGAGKLADAGCSSSFGGG